jgi:serine/threonine-protein kinase
LSEQANCGLLGNVSVAALAEGDFVTPSIRLVRKLGAGGMGSVWIAEHLTLHTQVVVKFLAGSLVHDEVSRARFSREAASASQVKSPHVVQMLDHGVAPNGLPFITMELLDGEDLAKRLQRQRVMPPQEVAAIVAQVCKALSRAHAAGVIHRDIKPDNIFLCDAGEGEIFVKVLDFGIAKRPAEESNATVTGQAIGTPSFMSPEQLVGSKDVDKRSDLWSVAIVTFLALTGARPFTGGTIGAVAIAIHTQAHPKPTDKNPDLPKAIDAWFAKACHIEPEERYQSARELADALFEALGLTPTSPRADRTGELHVNLSGLRLISETTPVPTGVGRAALSVPAASAESLRPAATTGDATAARLVAERRKKLGLVAIPAVLVFLVLLFVFTRGGANDDKQPSAASSAASAFALPELSPPSATAAKTAEPAPTATATASVVTTASVSAEPEPTAPVAHTGPRRWYPPPRPTATAAPTATTKPTATKPPGGYDDIE